MAVVTLYHGTRSGDFAAFDESSVGRGGDANSALGIHCTESPAVAASYAGGDGSGNHPDTACILIVEAAVSRARLTCSANEFYGTNDSGEKVLSADHYSELRTRLTEEGFDALVTDDIGEDAGTWVILDPAHIRIVGVMPVEEGFSAVSMSDYPDVEMDWTGELFDADLLNPPSARMGM